MDTLSKVAVLIDPEAEHPVDREIMRELLQGEGTIERAKAAGRCDENTAYRRMGKVLIRELLKKREELNH